MSTMKEEEHQGSQKYLQGTDYNECPWNVNWLKREVKTEVISDEKEW